MANEKPLTEQEKRYLNALKLFLERNGDSEHLESVKMFDLSPKQARAMIEIYHVWLEDPQRVFLAYRIYLWISPIQAAWAQIKFFLS
jgi:hypothetical protein